MEIKTISKSTHLMKSNIRNNIVQLTSIVSSYLGFSRTTLYEYPSRHTDITDRSSEVRQNSDTSAPWPHTHETADRYPVWIEEHKESLSEEEYQNYSKQLELMKKIVEEFEAESESDSEEVKNKRFQRIMGHLQQMHSLGHPPAELFGGESIDEAAMPNLPPGMDPNQCSMM